MHLSTAQIPTHQSHSAQSCVNQSHANQSQMGLDSAPTPPSAPTLAIVVPCYNEEPMLPHTHSQLSAKLVELVDSGIISTQSFLCYVDDGSRDRTWEILSAYAAESKPNPATLEPTSQVSLESSGDSHADFALDSALDSSLKLSAKSLAHAPAKPFTHLAPPPPF